MTFSPINASNYKSVAEIDRLSLGKEGWSEQLYEKEIGCSDKYYVVAYEEETVVGFGGCMKVFDEGDILNIAVHPSYRNQGIGTAILDKIVQEGTLLGIKSFTLEVKKSNLPAIRLYEKKGFCFVGVRKGYYNGEDACIYWLYL